MTVPYRLAWVLGAALLAGEGQAADLAAIQRRIANEPSYTSAPRYCLLVFGPEANTRVWLVQDGGTLYVDRNANGDLTEDGERVAATPGPDTNEDEGVYLFQLGDVVDGSLLHKNLQVQIARLVRFAERDEEIAAYLEFDPHARGYSVSAQVDMPGWKSVGLGGRVEQVAALRDARGFLRFADRLQDAPILHFGGDWQIVLGRKAQLLSGRDCELLLGLGTPGVGPGTTVFSGYEGIVPPDVHPTVALTYPSEEGGPQWTESHELAERCCTINLYGFIRAPFGAGTGMAQARISFESWPAGNVAPSHGEVEVVHATPTVAEVLPVSSRLIGSLPHPHRSADIGNLSFSPDGARLLASDYPGGVVQVWDVESRAPLVSIETGYGYRGDSRHIFLTPDWRSVYSWQENRPQAERYEADGRQMIRYRSDSTLSVWDVETGELRRTFAHDPARGIRLMRLSPDGSAMMTLEQLPGEYELGAAQARAASLWDTETGESRPLPHCGVFSSDGQTIAVPFREGALATAIHLLDTATLAEKVSIAIVEESALAEPLAFSPDGRLLVGYVVASTTPPSSDRTLLLKFWDVATGQEKASLPGEEFGIQVSAESFSPDGRWCAAVDWQARDGRLSLLDLKEPAVARSIQLPERANIRAFAFCPQGTWLAVVTQALPEKVREDVTAEELPQPRIHLLDVASGETRETLIAPQAIGVDVRFSPDGRTLASGGQGCVLLWDFSTPPR